jgi:DNA-binding response OmpR family regulator
MIAVIDTDEKQCRELCLILEERQYRAIPMHSLARMESYVHDNTFEAVIIDINTVPVDDQIIKELKIKNPNSFLFFLSKDRFHPHLRESLGSHVFACISRPIDLEEFFYCLDVIDKIDA